MCDRGDTSGIVHGVRDLRKHEERKRELKRRLAEKAAKPAQSQND